jgi:hypothetical protein
MEYKTAKEKTKENEIIKISKVICLFITMIIMINFISIILIACSYNEIIDEKDRGFAMLFGLWMIGMDLFPLIGIIISLATITTFPKQ